MTGNKDYIDELRIKIIKQLDDLKSKIENNEPCPEKNQDIDMLVDISDNIDLCLNNWYY